MIEQVESACCGCAACVSICPRQCIEMHKKKEGFLYPVVRQQDCVHCGLCKTVCPAMDVDKQKQDNLREAWGCIVDNKPLLLESSSGGLFTLLSKSVLDAGGCVFGAAFSPDYYMVRHICVESTEELGALRGSKYLQSEIGDCYHQVKNQLESGRVVLFSGTPCQIAGLKNYLGRDYENLLSVDVICHGTPSPALWQRYLSHVEQLMGGKACHISFRHKENGWRQFGMDMPFAGGKRYYKTLGEDPYLKMFLKNYCLRESCYDCKVKEAGSSADITIGDFWGVERVEPEIDNSMGVSLALIHTGKGKRVFDLVRPMMNAKRTDYQRAIGFNSAMTVSVARPPERDRFFGDMERLSWEKLEKKYTAEKTKTKLKRALSKSFVGTLRRKLLHVRNE